MKKESTYVIYTDASFDDFTKIGTYAIIITQENKILKHTAKRCMVQMNNATECEVFAVYQAINIILNKYVKSGKKQKFKLKTDCTAAKDFFLKDKYSKKMFLDNSELTNSMKKTYKTLCKHISNKESSFSLTWIPRKSNKIAHKCSYTAFQRLKQYEEKREVVLIDKSSFLEILLNGKREQNEIIKYLFYNSDEQKIILKTQKEMSNALNMSISKINRNLNNLIDLNVLEKVENGKYAILI